MPRPGLLAADPEVLPDFLLDPASLLGRRFLERGTKEYRAVARYVMRLPYGRNTDRSDYWLVLEEGRGTCSTKHALLAALARKHDRPVNLRLGIYEMNGRNTPGVGPALRRHGLDLVPEAHCYLAYRGVRVDITGAGEAEQQIQGFLHEEEIEPSQIGAYKVERHWELIQDWATVRGFDPETVWRVREECVQVLSTSNTT